jgi:hypothetical protein
MVLVASVPVSTYRAIDLYQTRKEYREIPPCSHPLDGITQSSESSLLPTCDRCAITRNDLKEKISDLEKALALDIADSGRQGVGIGAGIAVFFSPLAAAGLTVAGGILNILVGLPVCAVSIRKLVKNQRQRRSLESHFEHLDPSKKSEINSLLNFWQKKGNEERIKNAAISTFIYGGVTGFGIWGIVSGSLAIAGITGAAIATGGAVAGGLFAGILLGWGIWTLCQLIRKHRATKATQSELSKALQDRQELKAIQQELKAKVEEKSKNTPASLGRSMDIGAIWSGSGIGNIEKQMEVLEERRDALADRWLHSSPQAAARYLLQVLFSSDQPDRKGPLEGYLKELHQFLLKDRGWTDKRIQDDFEYRLEDLRSLWETDKKSQAVRQFCRWMQLT